MERNLDQLNEFAEKLDGKINEIVGRLQTTATSSQLLSNSSKIYGQLNKDLKYEVDKIYSDIDSKYNDKLNNQPCKFYNNVYTKAEIDKKGFLTEHQSLDGYLKKGEAEQIYIQGNDIHAIINCNCVKKSDVDKILSNYVKSDELKKYLDSIYTINEVDSKLLTNTFELKELISDAQLELLGKIKNIENKVKSYYISKTTAEDVYLSKSEASSIYLPIEYHNELNDYIEDNFIKKDDFIIDDFVTKEAMSNYLTTEYSDLVNESIYELNKQINTLELYLSATQKSIKDHYLTSGEINKLYLSKDVLYGNKNNKNAKEIYTISELNELFLRKKDGYNSFLTKKQCDELYLSIEDYKRMTSILGISDYYYYQTERLFKLNEEGKIVDGIYLTEQGVFIVKSGKIYQQSTFGYSKPEIDAMGFITEDWLNENYKHLDWNMTDDY